MRKAHARRQSRRGIIVVLAAVIMIVLLGLVALAIDSGYMVLVRTELQNAADSAALAAASNLEDPAAARDTAQQFAAYHSAGARDLPVVLADSDVQFGTWDANARTFTTTNDNAGTAVKITAKRNDSTGGNHMFFGWVFGRESFNVQASAVAMGQPRDICLVVDLSGSMNDDTEPGYSGTGAMSGTYASIRTQMMKDLYADFGFGSAYPGTQQTVGQPLGVSTYSALSSNSSGAPLRASSIPTTYRILSGDSTSTRKTKTYKWIIDYQIATIMPSAKPTPLSSNTASYNYWAAYLDTVTGQSTQYVGPRTYIQWMMDAGRETKPNGTDYAQMSINSPNCPRHNETVDGQTFSFPPREQPTHACRRSLISAIQEVKRRNINVSDNNQKDWVSIVTFDTVAGTALAYSLSGNYDSAMTVAANVQACSDVTSTATETGLIAAYNHLKPTSQGGHGRISSQKVVVLLTDGMPNLKTSSNTTVSNYRSAHPSSNFYGGSSNYNHDAALMQYSTMNSGHWKGFAVGVGLDADEAFLDRMARMGSTADEDGHAPQTAGDPSEYETELREIFRQIINTPTVRLVQ